VRREDYPRPADTRNCKLGIFFQLLPNTTAVSIFLLNCNDIVAKQLGLYPVAVAAKILGKAAPPPAGEEGA